jgi:hypothetical protein
MAVEDELFALWTSPPDTLDDPVARFAELYADPVVVNGAPMPVVDLVARARGLHEAFDEHEIEIVDRIESPGKLAIAFRHRARHAGPWQTPMGVLPPTGRVVTGLGIDLLTFTEGRIGSIWVLADELQRLLQIRAD